MYSRWVANTLGSTQVSDGAKTKRRMGRTAPTVIIIEHSTLARTTVVKLLEHELAGWNFIDLISTESLDRALGAEVRLIALDLAGRSIESISLRDDLAAIAARFPEASITLLSGTDDVDIARQALKMGIRGFFSTSLPIDTGCPAKYSRPTLHNLICEDIYGHHRATRQRATIQRHH